MAAFRTCPRCGEDSCEPLGQDAFAATWECPECYHLWDFTPEDVEAEAEFLGDCWIDMALYLLQLMAKDRTAPGFIWQYQAEWAWLHSMIVPLRLNHSQPRRQKELES